MRDETPLRIVISLEIMTHSSHSQGLTSVRAFRLQGRFGERHRRLLDTSTQCWWPLVTSNRWLSVRLEFIGTGLVFCTAVAAAVVLPQRYMTHDVSVHISVIAMSHQRESLCLLFLRHRMTCRRSCPLFLELARALSPY